MSNNDILRKGFVAFLDGLWWGLRDNTGALSMYEGYSNGFMQMGREAAEADGGKGPENAARIAANVLRAIGLDVEHDDKEVTVKSCPLWDRILERGLEYAFHIEEICWKPLLEGIAEKAGGKPVVESSLRLAHIERAKAEYKKGKAKASIDKGVISESEFDQEMDALDRKIRTIPTMGRYRFV